MYNSTTSNFFQVQWDPLLRGPSIHDWDAMDGRSWSRSGYHQIASKWEYKPLLYSCSPFSVSIGIPHDDLERNRESFLSSNSLSGFYFYFFSPLPRSRVSYFFFSLAHLPLFIRLLSLFLFSCFFFSLSRAEIVSFPELTDLRISCLELLPLLKYALQDVLAHPRTVRFFTCKWFGF